MRSNNNDHLRRSSRTPKQQDDNLVSKRKRDHQDEDSSDEETVKRIALRGNKADTYCWICHKLGQEKICNTCPRAFHANCIKKDALKFNDSGSCVECNAKSCAMKFDPLQLKKLIEHALKVALQEKLPGKNTVIVRESQTFVKYFKTWPLRTDNTRLCQIMDLDLLIDKLNDVNAYYRSTAEFFSDVKCIYHNCVIAYGTESEITEAAVKFEKNIKLEMTDIDACAECYSRKHSEHYDQSFTEVCQKPHQIVWAKIRGSPYWPAKCLKIFKGTADVRFFGTHDKSHVPVNHCFKISQRSPNERELKQHKYLEALDELSAYINKYKRIHFTFPYAPDRTPLIDSKSKKGGKHSKENQQEKRQKTQQESNICNTVVSPQPHTSKVTHLPPSGVVCTKVEVAKDNNIDDYASAATFSTTNISENPSTFHKSENATSSVAVCMTFSTDNDASANDQLTNSSESQEQSTVIFNDSSIFHSMSNLCVPKVLETCTNIIRSSEQFINEESSTLMPVITSAVSECKNVAMDYEDNLFISQESLDCSERALFNILAAEEANCDDDIEVLKEVKGNSDSVNMLVQDRNIGQAFCQILVRREPSMRDFYKICQSFGRQTFLHMWLSSRLKHINREDILVFRSIYRAAMIKYNNIKNKIRDLKEMKNVLIDENEKYQKLNKKCKEELDARTDTTTLILEALRQRYEIRSWHESEFLSKEAIPRYTEKFNALMAEKDRELDQRSNIIEELKEKVAKLQSKKSSRDSVAASAVLTQTDISYQLRQKKFPDRRRKSGKKDEQSITLEIQQDHFIFTEREEVTFIDTGHPRPGTSFPCCRDDLTNVPTFQKRATRDRKKF